MTDARIMSNVLRLPIPFVSKAPELLSASIEVKARISKRKLYQQLPVMIPFDITLGLSV